MLPSNLWILQFTRGKSVEGIDSSWALRSPGAAAAGPPNTHLERTQPRRLYLPQGKGCDQLKRWLAFLPWGWENGGPATKAGGVESVGSGEKEAQT